MKSFLLSVLLISAISASPLTYTYDNAIDYAKMAVGSMTGVTLSLIKNSPPAIDSCFRYTWTFADLIMEQTMDRQVRTTFMQKYVGFPLGIAEFLFFGGQAFYTCLASDPNTIFGSFFPVPAPSTPTSFSKLFSLAVQIVGLYMAVPTNEIAEW